MATNPMLQTVMLFQHQQVTAPFQPVEPGALTRARIVTPPSADMAKPKEEKETTDEPPFGTLEEEDEENGENGDEENEESGEEKQNG